MVFVPHAIQKCQDQVSNVKCLGQQPISNEREAGIQRVRVGFLELPIPTPGLKERKL
jgi:hypothetical protein